MLRGLVDTTLANRKLFVPHERNQTALSAVHIKGHDGDHEEMEQQFRPATYGDLLREAITDLLEPRGGR